MSERVSVRELATEELPEAWELARRAFGASATPPPGVLAPAPGVTRYGAFDQAGRLVGRASELHHQQWWGGRMLSAADVGSLAVAPEARGRGVSRALLRAVLEGGRDRGAAVSALFPTASAVYQSAGWATVGAMRSVDVATAVLPRYRPGRVLAVRAGAAADVVAARELYTRIARSRNGMLSRSGPPFAQPSDRFDDGVDGLTVVEDGEAIVGFASWRRGAGYGPDAVLQVDDLVATTAQAARELIGILATWRSVTPTVRFRALPSGVVSDTLPLESAKEHAVARWMHRPVDVARAVSGRTWPVWLRAGMTFSVLDELATWNDGTWALEIAEGQGRLERCTTPCGVRLRAAGFALLYCGVASPAMLVEGGLLEFGSTDDLTALEALMAAPPPELLDYF